MKKTSYDNEYRVYIYFGKNEERNINEYELWNKCAKALDPVVGNSRYKGEINSLQLIKNSGKLLRIGPLEWNNEGHKLWTSSVHQQYGTENIEFKFTNIYFPGLECWDDEDITPEIAIKIYSKSHSDEKRFDFSIMIAFREDFTTKASLPSINNALQNLGDVIKPVFSVTKNRTWAIRLDEYSYEDSLQDFFPTAVIDKAEELTLRPEYKGWNIIS